MDHFYMEEPGFFESMFFGFEGIGVFGIIFVLIFLLIIGIFIFGIGAGIKQWSKNNNSPRLSVPAKVVTKRIDTWGGSGDSRAHTSYYVTFEVTSGDRMELPMNGSEYGLIAEDDLGVLTFQGSRFISFERKQKADSKSS